MLISEFQQKERHLAADHDVCDFGFAIAAVRLVVTGSYRQHKISRVTLTLSDQKTPVLTLLSQELLSLAARQVTMKPPSRNKNNVREGC